MIASLSTEKLMKKIIAIAIIAATSFATSAMAQNAYVTATVGQGDMRGTILDDHKDTAAGIAAGWQFNKNFAAEVGYTDLGKYSKDTVRAKGEVVQASLVGSYEVAPQLSLFARVGAAYTTLDVSGDFDGNGTHHKTTAVYGVGAEYKFTPQWAASVEFNQYNKFAVSESKVNTVTAGVKYSF